MTHTIGILLSSKVLKMATSGKRTHENIAFYEEFAAVYGLKPIYFSIFDISVKKNSVYAFHKQNEKYVRKSFPIPKVIHNRAMIFKPSLNDMMQQIRQKYNVKIYNEVTRYRKYYIHQLLVSDDRIKPYLPETKILTKASLFILLNKHKTCFIKPVSNSLGRGIIKVRQFGPNRYLCRYMFQRKQIAVNCNRMQLWQRISRLVGSTRYIVQQGIALAQYNNCPFDIRVSVQLNDKGVWQVTGATTKVAKPGHFLTNVAQGGKAIALKKVMSQLESLNYDEAMDKVKEVALLASNILSKKLRGIADLGYDIGIDTNGYPFIIELNGKDQRYSFKIAGEMEAWRNTFRNPIGYGKYLYCQMNTDLPLYPPINSVSSWGSSTLLPVVWRPELLIPYPPYIEN